MPLLHPGDMFPQLTLDIPGAQAIEVLLVRFRRRVRRRRRSNRGSLAPLSAPPSRAAPPASRLIPWRRSASGSPRPWVDDEKTTAEFTARHALTFPLGHSADAHAIAGLTGAFVNEDPLYLQSTGFVLDPQGKLIVSVYSSGAIGRLVPEDVIGLVRYLREHAAASSR